MINLHAILPELERDVAERVESKILLTLNRGDLRDLVYKLVERSQSSPFDPNRYFADLVATVAEREGDRQAARDQRAVVRVAVLRHLLAVLRPALSALVTPIVTQRHRPSPTEDEEREYHPYLVGFELLSGEKLTAISEGEERSGRSYWIVTIPGDNPVDAIDGRYAVAKHGGTEFGGVRHYWDAFELLSSTDLAAQIHDEQMVKMIRVLHRRLRGLADNPKITQLTDSLWRVAEILDEALHALRTSKAAGT